MATVSESYDRCFKFSEIIEKFNDYLIELETRSIGLNKKLGLKKYYYGDNIRQWVEISAIPPSAEIVPVLIHGGYWRALTAELHRSCLLGLYEQFGCVANVEYRLMPHWRMEDLVMDVVNAEYMIRRICNRRLILVGHSAGGHLALSAFHRGLENKESLAVATLSGIYDLRPVSKCFLQDELNLTEKEIKEFSLIDRTLKTSHCLIGIGQSETPEFHKQARNLAKQENSELVEIPGNNHMDILLELGDSSSYLMTQINYFVERTLNSHAGNSNE